jgi:hypothetical protein
MKMFFNIPKRLVLAAILMALMLTLCIASVAGAVESTSSPHIVPIGGCIVVASPAHQIVVVKQPAAVNIHLLCVAQTGQVYPPYPQAYFLVAWGDGKVSTYPYCFDVCPVIVPPFGTVHAVHAYQVTGDYHPTICLIEPAAYPAPSCTSVEIVVKGIA